MVAASSQQAEGSQLVNQKKSCIFLPYRIILEHIHTYAHTHTPFTSEPWPGLISLRRAEGSSPRCSIGALCGALGLQGHWGDVMPLQQRHVLCLIVRNDARRHLPGPPVQGLPKGCNNGGHKDGAHDKSVQRHANEEGKAVPAGKFRVEVGGGG